MSSTIGSPSSVDESPASHASSSRYYRPLPDDDDVPKFTSPFPPKSRKHGSDEDGSVAESDRSFDSNRTRCNSPISKNPFDKTPSEGTSRWGSESTAYSLNPSYPNPGERPSNPTPYSSASASASASVSDFDGHNLQDMDALPETSTLHPRTTQIKALSLAIESLRSTPSGSLVQARRGPPSSVSVSLDDLKASRFEYLSRLLRLRAAKEQKSQESSPDFSESDPFKTFDEAAFFSDLAINDLQPPSSATAYKKIKEDVTTAGAFLDKSPPLTGQTTEGTHSGQTNSRLIDDSELYHALQSLNNIGHLVNSGTVSEASSTPFTSDDVTEGDEGQPTGGGTTEYGSSQTDLIQMLLHRGASAQQGRGSTPLRTFRQAEEA